MYRSLTDGSGTDFPSFVQFSRLVTELFWSFSDLMHISLCFLSRKQGSVKCLTNKKLMATVKTVLVKGRSNRSGKFPLVVQVLHKRRKKVVYTGFSIPDTLFDPVKGTPVLAYHRGNISPPWSAGLLRFVVATIYIRYH